MTEIYYVLKQKWALVSLFIINFSGTIYGFIWYKSQLAITPDIFLAFVPDSPTASLFFSIVLLFFIFKKHFPLMEALAIVSLFKYGVWAVGMNIAGSLVTGSIAWANVMLILSHGGMAIEGLLYAPYYRIKTWHFFVAAIVVLHDLMIDYVFHMMPIYPDLYGYEAVIGYITFWLTIFTLFIVYMLCLRPQRKVFQL